MKHVVDLVQALAWPAAAVTIVWLLISRLGRLIAALPRDSRVKARLREASIKAGPGGIEASGKIDYHVVDDGVTIREEVVEIIDDATP